jgi:hypothetical protein
MQLSTEFTQKTAQRKGFRKILAMGTLLLVSAGLSGIAPSVSTTSAVGDSYGIWYVDASVTSSGDGKSESEAFKTIAEAINDVDTKDGDTIQVLEGTYDGFTVTKSVKILGPNDKIHPQDMSKDVPTPNPDRLTGEAVINGMVTFAAGIDDITLSGFKLVTSTEPAGVRVTTSDNVTITYNDFSSGGWPIDAQQSGLASTWVVSHNRIDDITEDVQTAIYLVNITNLTVENNFIRHDNPEADNRRGVNLDSSKNVTFTGNNIDMGARGVELPTTKALWAIQLAMDEGAVEDVTIENNWIRGARTGISGLSKNSLTNVAIRQNTIYDTLSGIVLDQGGVPPLPGVSPVTAGLEISGNDITFFEYGVWLRGVTQWLHGKEFKYSDVAISGNRFTLSPPPTDSSCTARGKGLGAGDCKPVRVYEKTFIDGFNTGKINARGNFWGTEEGPSANQKEESQVDSGGWISAYDDDPAKVNHPGFWPDSTVKIAPLTVCASGCAYVTIQEAIGAATSGDTVSVGAGTYAEELEFTSAASGIVLKGAGQDQTFIIPARNYAVDNHAIAIRQADGVTIEDLSINGAGNSALDAGENFRDGILWENGGDNNTIRNVTIKNIDRRGISVYPNSIEGTTISGVSIDNVTAAVTGSANGYALMFNGSGLVENNVFTNIKAGVGGVSRAPADQATIFNNNTISSLTGIDASRYNVGINYWAGNVNQVQITNNKISGNVTGNTGIYLVNPGAGSSISDNSIILAGDGGIGIETGWTTSSGPLIERNVISMSTDGLGILTTGQGASDYPVKIRDNDILNTSTAGEQSFSYSAAASGAEYVTSGREVGILASADRNTSWTEDTTGSLYVEITGNDIGGFTNGLAFIEDSDAVTSLSATVSDNSIRATGSSAVYVTETPSGIVPVPVKSPTYPAIDLDGNYWGDATPDFNAILSGWFEHDSYFSGEPTNVVLNADTTTVTAEGPLEPLAVVVDRGTTGAGVNYTDLLTDGAGTIPQTTITTSDGVIVKIPKTRITPDVTSWDGVIQSPTVVANSSVTIPAESGTTVTVATAIKVGASTIGLTFVDAVRVLLPNDSDKLVGFVRDGTFSKITTKCSADSQAVGNELAEAGDCFISVGSDMVIWTKHFTTFVAYSSVATPAPAPAPAAPYAGPIVSSIDKAAVTPGSLVTLSGTKLDVVTKVTVDEVNVAIVSQAASSLTLRLPEAITPGVKTIVLVSSFGSLRVQNIVTIIEAEDPAVPTPELDQKVNAGSFKGFVAIYAKGYKGQRLSVKVAGRWLKVDALDSRFERVVRFTGEGRNIKIDIYIDRKLQKQLQLITR